jgi:two-component system sensor histidine kinase CpxA
VVIEPSGQKLAVVTISDRGPGVDEEALAQMFQPFYRAVNQPPRASGGAGLGLAIAHRAVTMHQGQIQARNRSEGGLMVEIQLPISSHPFAF